MMNFIKGKTRLKYGGAYVDKTDRAAIDKVLDSNWWTIGEEGKQLEKELAEFTQTKYATLASSGSNALMVAYASLGLPEGSEIITGAVQFPTSISSMYYNHFKPVFIDVDINNYNLDPSKIKDAVRGNTKAILVVAVGGLVPNIEAIITEAKKYNLVTILDNCDGFGGIYQGEPIESYFDISVTSFHAAHILCMGEGGAVFTNNPEYAKRMGSIREWGRRGGYDDIDKKEKVEGIPSDYPARYLFDYMGFNMKPLELQCALGRTQLQKVNKIKEMRYFNFTLLYNQLLPLYKDKLLLPSVPLDTYPSYFCLPFLASNRGNLREFLESRNIETRTIFGGNITRQPAFKNFGRVVGKLTNADKVMSDGMFVSVHPDLTAEMVNYIAESIKEFYARTV